MRSLGLFEGGHEVGSHLADNNRLVLDKWFQGRLKKVLFSSKFLLLFGSLVKNVDELEKSDASGDVGALKTADNSLKHLLLNQGIAKSIRIRGHANEAL